MPTTNPVRPRGRVLRTERNTAAGFSQPLLGPGRKFRGERKKRRKADPRPEGGDDTFSLQVQEKPDDAATPGKGKNKTKPGGRSKSAGDPQGVSYRHQDKRKNNPQIGLVSPETDPGQPKTTWSYDPHLDAALQFDIGRAQVEKIIDDALASGDGKQMRVALQAMGHLGCGWPETLETRERAPLPRQGLGPNARDCSVVAVIHRPRSERHVRLAVRS